MDMDSSAEMHSSVDWDLPAVPETSDSNHPVPVPLRMLGDSPSLSPWTNSWDPLHYALLS